MNEKLIKIYASKYHIPLSDLVALIRRQDPLDTQAGAHIKDQDEVKLYLDHKNKVVYRVGSTERLEKLRRDQRISVFADQKHIPVALPIAEPTIVDGQVISASKYVVHDPAQTPDPVQVGKTLVKLHQVKFKTRDFPIVTSQLPDLVTYALNHDRVSPQIKAAIRRRALPCIKAVTEDMRKGKSLIHGDFHLGNILPTKNGPVFIDFECGGVGSPLWDLAVIVQSSTRFGLDRKWANACLDSWNQGRSYDKKLLGRYVDWRYWYGALSMIRRVHEGSGNKKELQVRLKWVLDSRDHSRWRRC